MVSVKSRSKILNFGHKEAHRWYIYRADLRPNHQIDTGAHRLSFLVYTNFSLPSIFSVTFLFQNKLFLPIFKTLFFKSKRHLSKVWRRNFEGVVRTSTKLFSEVSKGNKRGTYTLAFY